MDTCIVMRALCDPTRLSAVRILWGGGEHCVCELMEALGTTQSRMSRHMAALKVAGLVVDRRDAQRVRYSRNPGFAPALSAVVDAVLAANPAPKKKTASASAAWPTQQAGGAAR